ncbi:MAG: dITP/XTP pyrophosphatase [Chlamydiia bacterium]|nr:dITP/XTP pyrophosphatase [Chlamydiia bacterium]MCH9616390.1 dITP/XTP pyrophosphatase [Chlamydiia bacterium]MCH9629624.1 dITP/XTP pyrophosphatase [Chlamydiia bacterium]
MEIVLATKNLHKIREFKAMLKEFKHLDILTLRDFPDYEQPPEDGNSFEANAEIKALHAAKMLNKKVIADDSGLVVPALGGAPGIKSARYAGETASDKDNRQKLMEAIAELPEHKRACYFECCLVVAGPEGVEQKVSGLLEGSLINEERGRNGFGYDPMFLKHDYSKTLAELEESTKNLISHRRKALDKLALSH